MRKTTFKISALGLMLSVVTVFGQEKTDSLAVKSLSIVNATAGSGYATASTGQAYKRAE